MPNGQVLAARLREQFSTLDEFQEDSNQARKHVGMKFEALVGATFNALGIGSGHLVFNIPGGEGEPRYRAETDFVIGPDKSIISTSGIHDPRETIVSVKGSSKDRMSKIFIDRPLLETIVGHRVKMIAIFHNQDLITTDVWDLLKPTE